MALRLLLVTRQQKEIWSGIIRSARTTATTTTTIPTIIRNTTTRSLSSQPVNSQRPIFWVLKEQEAEKRKQQLQQQHPQQHQQQHQQQQVEEEEEEEEEKKRQKFKKLFDNEIVARTVHLIDEKSKSVGLMDLNKALNIAHRQQFHLVQLGFDNDHNPLCKIVDEQFLVREQELLEEKNNKNKVKTPKLVKDITFTTFIAEHDFDTKIQQIKKLLTQSKPKIVRVRIDFRGKKGQPPEREMARGAMANLLERVFDFGRMVNLPHTEGNCFSAELHPLTKTSKSRKTITPQMILEAPLPLLHVEKMQLINEEQKAFLMLERKKKEDIFRQ